MLDVGTSCTAELSPASAQLSVDGRWLMQVAFFCAVRLAGASGCFWAMAVLSFDLPVLGCRACCVQAGLLCRLSLGLCRLQRALYFVS